MILCDACNKGTHTTCLDPPLAAVPKGPWLRTHCDTEADPSEDPNETPEKTPMQTPKQHVKSLEK